jgi:hypothetical protein
VSDWPEGHSHFLTSGGEAVSELHLDFCFEFCDKTKIEDREK